MEVSECKNEVWNTANEKAGFPIKTILINDRNINAEGRNVRMIISFWYLLAVTRIFLGLFVELFWGMHSSMERINFTLLAAQCKIPTLHFV